MWCFPNDQTVPIITAEAQLNSSHRDHFALQLPETAILFFMSRGVNYVCAHYAARELPEPFPCFLNRRPVWELADDPICFLDGGRGSPQACDTVETLAALGVKRLIAVGMFGAFDPRISIGEIIAPEKAFVEEGTSLHYYASIEYAAPDDRLLKLTALRARVNTYPIVTTDAVYRQTFYKEQIWREKGAVGVDMETSAVFSVSRYPGLEAVGLLMASDLHPQAPGDPKWEWKMTREMRWDLTERSLVLARQMIPQ